MWEDPIVAEVRRVKEELAARFGFDVAAMFADLRKGQAEHGDRLVRLDESKANSNGPGEPPSRSNQPASHG